MYWIEPRRFRWPWVTFKGCRAPVVPSFGGTRCAHTAWHSATSRCTGTQVISSFSRYNYDSTVRRPFDDLPHESTPTCVRVCCCAAVWINRSAWLRPVGYVIVHLMTFDKQSVARVVRASNEFVNVERVSNRSRVRSCNHCLKRTIIFFGTPVARHYLLNKLCGRPPQYAPVPLQFDLWPFNLESGVQVTCEVGYLCANFSLPRVLSSRLRPDVSDRQTHVRQNHRLMLPPISSGV